MLINYIPVYLCLIQVVINLTVIWSGQAKTAQRLVEKIVPGPNVAATQV